MMRVIDWENPKTAIVHEEDIHDPKAVEKTMAWIEANGYKVQCMHQKEDVVSIVVYR